jgi:hypothetical protein
MIIKQTSQLVSGHKCDKLPQQKETQMANKHITWDSNLGEVAQ